MQEFANLQSYLDDIGGDPGLAAIPVSVVADHLSVTPAAISGMLKRGRLEEIRIGNSRLVSVRSLTERRDSQSAKVATVYAKLKELAHTGRRSMFYEPIMADVGLTSTVPAHRTQVGEILAQVSKASFQTHGVLLSVLVHRKTAGHTKPGPGFFALAKELGFTWNDEQRFLDHETDKVLEAFR